MTQDSRLLLSYERRKISEEIISNELRSIREIIKDLSKPVAKRHLRKRKHGGKLILTVLLSIPCLERIVYLEATEQ